MDQQTAVGPKRGRPPKAPEKGKRQNYTFRLSTADRNKLESAATASERSLSEEIEQRVIQSFEREELETMLRRVVNER